MEYDQLKEGFQGEMNRLVKDIHIKAQKIKMVENKPLTGSMLLNLAMEYCNSLNDSETPTVMSALERVVQAEAINTVDSIIDEF